MKYNRNVLEQFAERLEAEANRVVVLRGLLWGLVFAGIGGFLAGRTGGQATGAAVLIAFLVGVVVGIIAAQGESLRLRVQAAMILLQVQIEQNTRKDAAK